MIVDASIAVKWFIPEPQSDKAEALLLSGQKLFAPEIIQVEVASAMTKLIRMKVFSQSQIQPLLDKWRQYLKLQAISLEPNALYLEHAEELAVELNHPFADCLYLAVANKLKVDLITADGKFLKKAIAAHYSVVEL